MNWTNFTDLLNVGAFTKEKKDLKRMRCLMKILGDPQDSLKFIHIAGSNGKGSVSLLLKNILLKSGYNVGFFTSPHIRDVNERFAFNNQMILDEELRRYIDILNKAVLKMPEKPGLFEIITAIGFLYFKDKGAEIVVLETGLGGRLDATNIIKAENTIISIITSISLEHSEILGNSLREIAFEKAGIIKENVPLISIIKEKEVSDVLIEKSKDKNVRFYKALSSDTELIEAYIDGQIINYKELKNLYLSLVGKHQRENLSIVLKAVICLKDLGYIIEESSIRSALKNSYWPGRLELLSNNPLFIIDGAHNPSGIFSMLSSLNEIFPEKKYRFIIGLMKEKDYKKILDLLIPYSEQIILEKPYEGERSMDTEVLSNYIKDKNKDIIIKSFNMVSSAIEYLYEHSDSKSINIICGSLYQISSSKDVLDKLKIQKQNI